MSTNKKIIQVVTTIILAVILLASPVFAENTTGNAVADEKQNTSTSNTATNTETTQSATNTTTAPAPVTTQKTTTSTKQTTTTATKSSNANLSNLGITPHDFSGFKENKTEYDVTVPNTITEVEVYATKKDSKASITGTGKITLQEGNNVAKVVVTAEDGTTKTYTINIKRLKSGEQETVNSDSSGIALEKLEITGLNLEPNFNKDVYQYKVSLEGSETKLNIVAEANQASATVKIIGNEKLINGENIINVIVTDSKETSAVTYQITVNKNVVSQEELNKQLDEAETQYQIKQWIIRILIIVIVMCIIILLILIYKKINNKESTTKKEDKQIKKERFKNPYAEDDEEILKKPYGKDKEETFKKTYIEEPQKEKNKGNKKSGKHSK